MKTTIFPTVEEARYLHEILIEKFGGSLGLRDLGLLESALIRPQSGFYETLCHQAAAFLHSLISNHCFIDGNKRIAFALTAVFLEMNGYSLIVSADEAEKFIVDQIIVGKIDAIEIAIWIEDHLKKL